jgi:hypothetical protein
MARIQERQKAINLRLQGWTYNAIKRELGISKSTLSGWLSKYPLTEDQLLLLQSSKDKSREIAIEKTRNTKHKKREIRLSTVYKIEKDRWMQLNQRELELAGLFLYWGEGGKALQGQITLNNTDPQVLKFTLFWLTKGLGVSKEKIKVYLQLYSDMDQEKEIQFWSNELRLPLSQFGKPYIKESKRIDIMHKGFGHGTCGITVNNTLLKEKIIMGIKSIADYYSQQI